MSYLKHQNGQEGVVLTKKATYNSIVDKAMATRSMGGYGSAQCDTTVISVWNIGNQEIPQGGFIVFPSVTPLRDVEDVMQQRCVPCYGFTEGVSNASIDADTAVWGIAQEPIPAGRTGTALVSGMAVIKLSSSPSANSMNFVTPTSTYNIALSDTGTARLLCYDENGLASVLLNAGGAGAMEKVDASKPFSVSKVNSNTIFVNGGYVQETGYTRFEFPGEYVEITQDCSLYLIPSPRGCGIEILNLPYGSIFDNRVYYTLICNVFVKVIDDKIVIKEITAIYNYGNITLPSTKDFYAYRVLDNTGLSAFKVAVHASEVELVKYLTYDYYSQIIANLVNKETANVVCDEFTIPNDTSIKYQIVIQLFEGKPRAMIYPASQSLCNVLRTVATVSILEYFGIKFLYIYNNTVDKKTYQYVGPFAVNFWNNNTVECTSAIVNYYNTSSYDSFSFALGTSKTNLTVEKSGYIIAHRENLDKEFEKFEFSEKQLISSAIRFTIAYVEIGPDGNIVSINQLVRTSAYLHWYYGGFAIIPVGDGSYLVKGGTVYPGGRIEDTVISVSGKATVYVVVSYSVDNDTFSAEISLDSSAWAGERVLSIAIGNIDNGYVNQIWNKGDKMSVFGMVL